MTDAPPPKLYDLTGKRVWVAGHRGMVGAALVRRLEGSAEILTVGRDEVDLRDQAATRAWMARERPEAIFLAAARVGGILANATHPAGFLYDNLMIAANVIHTAAELGTEKLLFLGSSCIYPRDADQPIREEALLTGPLEATNEAYAIAKIAGLKLAEAYRREHGCDFISAQPTNLYGPGDNYDLETSHVLPALYRKVVEARDNGAEAIEIWGTGTPRREFLHVDDCADAMVHVMERYSDTAPVNLGCGEDISILDLTRLVMEIAGFEGEIRHDLSKPDGTPLKRLDISRLARLGWQQRIPLAEGIRRLAETGEGRPWAAGDRG